MGSVSTALSEEALSKCIQKSIYQAMPSEIGEFGSDENEDEVKCTICQVFPTSSNILYIPMFLMCCT